MAKRTSKKDGSLPRKPTKKELADAPCRYRWVNHWRAECQHDHRVLVAFEERRVIIENELRRLNLWQENEIFTG